MKTKRWNWQHWLARLSRSGLSPEAKTVVRKLAELGAGRKPRWIQGWQISWEHGASFALYQAEVAGLVWRASGTAAYLAVMEKRRRPDSIRLSPGQLKLMDRLASGWKLWHVVRTGQITSGTWTGWMLCRDGSSYPRLRISDKRINRLGRMGLLRADGTIWFSCPGYRANTKNLVTVRNRTPAMGLAIAQQSAYVMEEEYYRRHDIIQHFRGAPNTVTAPARIILGGRYAQVYDSSGEFTELEIPVALKPEDQDLSYGALVTYRRDDFSVLRIS
jgi:hypothetical protein